MTKRMNQKTIIKFDLNTTTYQKFIKSNCNCRLNPYIHLLSLKLVIFSFVDFINCIFYYLIDLFE